MLAFIIASAACASLATFLAITGWWRLAFHPFTIRPARMTVARLGLEVHDAESVTRVDTILRSFITAFNRIIASPSDTAWLGYCKSLPALYQPFAHEGAAMGYTVRRLFQYDPEHFERTIVRPRPEFRYLYYVGLGFWSGLRRHSPQSLASVVRRLDPLHSYLVYDGYGFARFFFESRRNPRVLDSLNALDGYLRNAAYQGVGRAMYFLHMGDLGRLNAEIDRLGEHAADAAAGVGLAAVFVSPDHLEVAQQVGHSFPAELQSHFHLGMCFGLKARSINDLDEFERNLAHLAKPEVDSVWASIRECDRIELLVRSDNTADGYRRWRERVTDWMRENIEFPMVCVREGQRNAAATVSRTRASGSMR